MRSFELFRFPFQHRQQRISGREGCTDENQTATSTSFLEAKRERTGSKYILFEEERRIVTVFLIGDVILKEMKERESERERITWTLSCKRDEFLPIFTDFYERTKQVAV